MARRLTARSAATTKPGRYGDGDGLWLAVAPSGAKKWVFRFSFGGRVTEMGLGAAKAVGLARARELASAARKVVADGKNPITVRHQAVRAELAKPTFGEMVRTLIAAKRSEWRNEKHGAQWVMTLETYAAPLCPRRVDEIDTEAVLSVLQPIWSDKPETASRLRGRIEAVLDAARAKGHIPQGAANPARWRGHLDKLLAKRAKLTRGHHAAMAYEELPGFIAELRRRDSTAALALEFTILTAARSGEALGARWDEFDLAKALWTVPAKRMKAGREHRIPLSRSALLLLDKLAETRSSAFVFAGQRAGKSLSGMAMEMVLRRMRVERATVHGFRSAFRDWAGNETHFARELAESALAHVIGDKAEQAYRRSDALERRRELMEAWARYCDSEKSATVLQMARASP